MVPVVVFKIEILKDFEYCVCFCDVMVLRLVLDELEEVLFRCEFVVYLVLEGILFYDCFDCYVDLVDGVFLVGSQVSLPLCGVVVWPRVWTHDGCVVVSVVFVFVDFVCFVNEFVECVVKFFFLVLFFLVEFSLLFFVYSRQSILVFVGVDFKFVVLDGVEFIG